MQDDHNVRAYVAVTAAMIVVARLVTRFKVGLRALTPRRFRFDR